MHRIPVVIQTDPSSRALKTSEESTMQDDGGRTKVNLKSFLPEFRVSSSDVSFSELLQNKASLLEVLEAFN